MSCKIVKLNNNKNDRGEIKKVTHTNTRARIAAGATKSTHRLSKYILNSMILESKMKSRKTFEKLKQNEAKNNECAVHIVHIAYWHQKDFILIEITAK